MKKERLTTFSDSVIAVIITIMALELQPPIEANLAALEALAPQFLAYVLSFAFVAIYWSNHHHLLQAAERVSGRILWANANFLFWLSLTPFATAWMSRTYFASAPVAIYGVSLLASAFSYFLLTRALRAAHEANSILARALGAGRKEALSMGLYVLAVAVSLLSPFKAPFVALALYALAALIRAAPMPRIERALKDARSDQR